MKRMLALLGVLLLLTLPGCANTEAPAQIAATTLPVYEFTSRLCDGTDLTITRLVTESVSCLHDYSLNVRQVKAVEAADVIVISGAGLEEFMEDILDGREIIDASAGIPLLESADSHADGGDHEEDPHIWLSPANASGMACNICTGLTERYPQYADTFSANLEDLLAQLDALQAYGEETLAALSCRDLITFHDGFAYFAQAFGLNILEAIEEESGSEASASELKSLIQLVQAYQLPAIFTETNGSVSAAQVICAETGAEAFTLDMAMASDSYFTSMYHNIDTIKEALG